MPDVAFVNGAFVSPADAKVSIDDRGFQFGDGIYEVIRTYGGGPSSSTLTWLASTVALRRSI